MGKSAKVDNLAVTKKVTYSLFALHVCESP